MAILTWRNVDAPNFSGALEGYRTASQLLSNAVKSGQDAVGAYTQANSDAADRAIMNRALGVQGSEEYRNALASGALIGPDGQNASMKLLGDLDTRTGTLLNRDVVRENLGQTQYTNQRGREEDAAMAAAGPDIALAYTLARNNDQKTLNKLLQTSPTIQKLRPGQLASLMTGVDTLSTSFQGRRSSDVNFSQGQWRFGNEVRDSNDAQTAQSVWQDIRLGNNTDADVQREVDSRIRGMSPGAAQRLVAAARGEGYNVYRSLGNTGDGTKGSSVQLAPTDNPLMDRFVSGLAKLETGGGSKTVKGPSGEDSNNLFNIKDPSGRGYRALDKAEGSRDAYRTYASAEEARADLMSLLQRRYPAALQAKTGAEFAKALKDGGYATDPDYIKKLTDAIGDTSGLRSSSLNNSNAGLASRQLRERASQNLAGSDFADIEDLQGDRRNSIQVVDAALKEGGALFGTDRSTALKRVNELVERSGNRINPAQALQMITNNLDGQNTGFWAGAGRLVDSALGVSLGSIPRGIRSAGVAAADALGAGNIVPDSVRGARFYEADSGDLGGGVRANDRGVDAALRGYLSGAFSLQGAAQDSLSSLDARRDSARTAYNNANSQYQQMVAAARNQPGLVGNLERYKQARDRAEQKLNEVLGEVSTAPAAQPRFDRPAPVATTARPQGNAQLVEPREPSRAESLLRNAANRLGEMGTDYTSESGKALLSRRVQESRRGGPALTKVERLRAQQAGLL